MTGMLLVDKPEGPTSHDVVNAARRALGERRVGHVGTLDPFASGLLVLLVGPATRLAKFLVGYAKRYTGVIRLGVTTDSDDPTGEVVEENDGWRSVTDDDILQNMKKLSGTIRQTPPVFSAKKVDGVRAYRRARRGEDFALAQQVVEVVDFRQVGRDGPDISFDVSVSSGTYIRSLARDLGEGVGVGGHLLKLRRETVGDFTVKNAVTVDEISADAVRPAGEAVSMMSPVSVTKDEGDAVRHGRAVHEGHEQEGLVALFEGTQLIAVAEVREGVLYPKVVLG